MHRAAKEVSPRLHYSPSTPKPCATKTPSSITLAPPLARPAPAVPATASGDVHRKRGMRPKQPTLPPPRPTPVVSAAVAAAAATWPPPNFDSQCTQGRFFPLQSSDYEALRHGPEHGIVAKNRVTGLMVLRLAATGRDPAEHVRVVKELGSCTAFLSFIGVFFADFHRDEMDVALELCELTLRTVIGSLSRLPTRPSIPESFLRNVAMATVVASQFLLQGASPKDSTVRQFVVRPDKIYVTASGVLKFSPNIPYDESHMDTDSYRYLAPETLRGEATPNSYDYHEKRIAWSLGVVLREMVLLQFPFEESSSVFAELRNIVEGTPKPLPAEGSLSGTFRQLLSSCVESNPAKRPTLEAIRLLMASVPVVERTVPLSMCTRENKALALATLCSAQRAQAHGLPFLPRELWDVIFQKFLFQHDNLRAWFLIQTYQQLSLA